MGQRALSAVKEFPKQRFALMLMVMSTNSIHGLAV
jgi:hypothetical protein